MVEWARAANQHPDVESAGFGEAAAQVRQVFEWVCPTSAAQQGGNTNRQPAGGGQSAAATPSVATADLSAAKRP
jgi:hypothetical protein